MRLFSCVCILTVAGSCISGMSSNSGSKPDTTAEVATLFLTGNELGMLKPCGCSGGQLGGLDRRPAILNAVQPSKRLVLDTGSFVEDDSEQSRIKLQIILEAFDHLKYDVVNLTDRDVEMVRDIGLQESGQMSFKLISTRRTRDVNVPAVFSKELGLKAAKITVNIAAFDPNVTPFNQIPGLFAVRREMKTVNALILNHYDGAVIEAISQIPVVDLVVCPDDSDIPRVISKPKKHPLVISVGKYGKYVGRLRIKAAKGRDKLEFAYDSVPMEETLPQETTLVELYKVYQDFVKEAGLLEKQPRYPLSNGLKYTGSKSCSICHGYEYEKWSTKGHAHAYKTLVDNGSQYDPECIRCHVVGFNYESGFVSEKETGHLKNVGCENCHGPGSKHISSLGAEPTTEPVLNCADCHTPEHSGGFLDHEKEYLRKIVHWREQKDAGNVK